MTGVEEPQSLIDEAKEAFAFYDQGLRRVPHASVSKVSNGAHVDTLTDFDSGRLRNTTVGTALVWA